MSCELCPRLCGVDRLNGETGYCGAGKLRIARAALHMWEEPLISGDRGSGTVFFSHCPLKCVYCQNREISSGGSGLEISVDRLCEIFFELWEKGAHNINLVSPTQYKNEIASAIVKAKKNGFKLPFVYNTSGYERAEIVRELDGLIDIYLTDFKYASPVIAKRYSTAADYPSAAALALKEMMRQQPKCVTDGDVLKNGVIVRHLMLPGCIGDTKDVIDIVGDICGDGVCFSLMRQYTPRADCKLSEIARAITDGEYEEAVSYALMCGIKNMFLQEKESVSESFIPTFDYEGVLTCGSHKRTD